MVGKNSTNGQREIQLHCQVQGRWGKLEGSWGKGVGGGGGGGDGQGGTRMVRLGGGKVEGRWGRVLVEVVCVGMVRRKHIGIDGWGKVEGRWEGRWWKQCGWGWIWRMYEVYSGWRSWGGISHLWRRSIEDLRKVNNQRKQKDIHRDVSDELLERQ